MKGMEGGRGGLRRYCSGQVGVQHSFGGRVSQHTHAGTNHTLAYFFSDFCRSQQDRHAHAHAFVADQHRGEDVVEEVPEELVSRVPLEDEEIRLLDALFATFGLRKRRSDYEIVDSAARARAVEEREELQRALGGANEVWFLVFLSFSFLSSFFLWGCGVESPGCAVCDIWPAGEKERLCDCGHRG